MNEHTIFYLKYKKKLANIPKMVKVEILEYSFLVDHWLQKRAGADRQRY